jgi:chromosome segregation ATPase
MSTLSSLRNTLNFWNGQKRVFDSRLKKLRDRRKDVVNVKNALKKTADDNAGDVNKRLRAARNNLDSAINYAGKDSTLNSILSGKDEHSVGSDSNLTSADGELQKEISKIDRDINDAQNDLTNANNKIRETNAAIVEEERRLREEAIRIANPPQLRS